MSWSARRVGTTLTLAAWAGLFWFLMASERTSFYLSSRTDWLVPVGAVLLTVAALGRALSLRSRTAEPLRRTDAWAIGLLVLPVVVVLALPPASLSSFAASRRSSFSNTGLPATG